jgi:glutamate synthase domain-containing protein 1
MTRSFASVDHDACGVGFVAQLGSPGSREVLERALEPLRRLGHRGGLDVYARSGYGASCSIAETWEAILNRFGRRKTPVFDVSRLVPLDGLPSYRKQRALRGTR